MVILAFDLGTSAIKSSLVSDSGQMIDTVTIEYKTTANMQSQAEQDPSIWWNGACDATKELLEKNPGAEIAAIGVSGHMLGCLPVNAQGEPLRPAIIHSDTRANLEAEYIEKEIGKQELYHLTGGILDAHSTLCKVLWLKRNEPEIYKKTARFLQSKDYLVSKLTGNIDITDFSDASHAQIINIYEKKYLTDIFKALSIDVNKFPSIYNGTDVVGHVNKESAELLGIKSGVPVIAGGGDGACSNVGAGISAEGDAYCSLGTTAWIAYNSGRPIIDDKARVFNIMGLDGKNFGVFGTMQTAGKSLNWAKDLFKLENIQMFESEAKEASEGSDGLIFLPYLEGERSPIFDSNARGMFFGISTMHERKHFERAVLEGIGYALRSILEVFNETQDISALNIIGGGARSLFWRQIIADICNVDIWGISTRSNSATSLGVALAACVGIGIFDSLGAATAHVSRTELTSPRPEKTAMYDHLYSKYMQLYPKLKMVF